MLKIIFCLSFFIIFFVFSIPDADGAKACSLLNLNEFILKSENPRVCERTNYWVHYECGRVEGLYLTDPRCQPPPGFPSDRLAMTGSFIDLDLNKSIFKMGETILVRGNAYTSVGLPDDELTVKIVNSNGQTILERVYKLDKFGKFGFEIQTGSSISINREDNYELHLYNYGKYGSSLSQSFTVSNDGLPIKEPEPIVVPSTSTQNSSTIDPKPFNNWTMIVGVVGVIAFTVYAVYKKFISGTNVRSVNTKDEFHQKTKESWEENVNHNHRLYPKNSDIKNNFSRYNDSDLEDLAILLFKAKGYTAKKQGKTRQGDGGRDIIANLQENEVFIQVKHWGPSGSPVDASRVRDFCGAVIGKTNKGILITTSRYTQPAQDEANDPTRSKFIELWDAEKFQEEVRHYLIDQDNSNLLQPDYHKQNFYEILGANRNDSPEEIKRKYKELALRFHPDKVRSSLGESSMKSLNEAYEILSDPEKRKHYDEELDS